jgi:site-specific recombinase XerD
MNKFELYLINNGLHFKVAERYRKIADTYIEWLKVNKLKVDKVKRSQFTDWLQTYREQGFTQHTLDIKENTIRYYYCFLGTKNNPAVRWVQHKHEHKLPPIAIEKKDLMKMYEDLKPESPSGYRDRCVLGLILFQGLKRSELEEMRITDLNFETGSVFVQGQRRSNSRLLKLEAFQMLHLYDYVNKYRKIFLAYKNADTDKFFLSQGSGASLNNVLNRLLLEIRRHYPNIKNLLHIRGSVITHWQKEHGIMEAMEKAGHCFVSSTQRYETDKYEKLQEQLRNIHPMENLNTLTS